MVQHMEPGALRVILFSLTNDPPFHWRRLEVGLGFETKYTHGPTVHSEQFVGGDVWRELGPDHHGDEGLVVDRFDLVTSEVVFGDVPMLSEATLGVEVSNAGNAPLTALDIASPFTLLEELPLVVEAEATTTLTWRCPRRKVDASVQLNVVSDDPAPAHHPILCGQRQRVCSQTPFGRGKRSAGRAFEVSWRPTTWSLFCLPARCGFAGRCFAGGRQRGVVRKRGRSQPGPFTGGPNTVRLLGSLPQRGVSGR